MGVEVFRLVSVVPEAGTGRECDEIRFEGRLGRRCRGVGTRDGSVVVAGAERACSAGKGDAQLFESDDDVVDPRPGLLEAHDGLAAGV